MKKFEFGLFALCVLIGAHFGSIWGIAVAICAFMTIEGLTEELIKKSKKNNDSKKEIVKNA